MKILLGATFLFVAATVVYADDSVSPQDVINHVQETDNHKYEFAALGSQQALLFYCGFKNLANGVVADANRHAAELADKLPLHDISVDKAKTVRSMYVLYENGVEDGAAIYAAMKIRDLPLTAEDKEAMCTSAKNNPVKLH